jgi:sortase A
VPRRRASFVGVLGEILITLGVVALLYVAWQMWVGDWIISAEKHKEASALSQSWMTPSPTATDGITSPTPSASAAPVETVVPVQAQPDHGTPFGVMFIPASGRRGSSRSPRERRAPTSWIRVRSGTTPTPPCRATSATPSTPRTGGPRAPFDPIDQLVIGDAIVIQTPDGWYTYRFRTRVRAGHPGRGAAAGPAAGRRRGERTVSDPHQCAPKLNMLERIIAYAVFESFTPTSAGPPASLAAPTVGASS